MQAVIVVMVLFVVTSGKGWAQESPAAVPDEPPDPGAWVIAPSSTGKVKEARFFHLRRMIRIDFTPDAVTLWLSPKLKTTLKGGSKASIEMIVKESPSWVPSLSLPGRYINLERVGGFRRANLRILTSASQRDVSSIWFMMTGRWSVCGLT